jgi:hypothetical protein
MTKAATKFGQELQTNLQLMIVKPSSTGGLQVSLLRTWIRFGSSLITDHARSDRLLLCSCE